MRLLLKIRFTLLTVVALLCTLVSWAQVSFTASAPALTAMDRPFRVEFELNSQPNDETFTSPSFEGFEVLAGPSLSTGRSVQWVNGQRSENYTCTYTYVLLPTAPGNYTIGAASVEVDGRKYSTRPLLIEVIAEDKANEQNTTPSPRQAGPSRTPDSRIGKDDILLRLKISDNDLYKGETLRASLVLYTRVNIDQIESLDLPPFDDFWSQELTFDNAPSREELNGRVYETYKIAEYMLSPQRSGKITIPSAVMNVLAQVVVQDNRGFDPIFGGRQIYHVKRELKSPEIAINVKEFPAGAPSSFGGAVGSFTMRSKMPERDIMANTAEMVEITISGSGNLKFITAPKMRMPESFELYDTKIVDNVKVSASGTSGSITYTYPFVARSSGEFVIEPVVFTYFDTAAGEYRSLSTERFTLNVADDGTASTSAAPIMGGGYADYGGRMKQLDRDIRYIHTSELPRRAASIFILSPAYLLIVVLLVALFITIYALMRRRIQQNRNVVARRMKHADKVAVQRLRLSVRYMHEGNRHAFYEELLRAMWGYISDKFNIPVSNLTKETIREELYRRGVSAADAEQFCQTISRADEAQYAPSTDGDMGEVYGDAVAVISKIESIVKR